jgi:hypothetical protein
MSSQDSRHGAVRAAASGRVHTFFELSVGPVILEHMFEPLVVEPLGWEFPGVEPLPGDEGYEAFLAFEAQQEAFWSAVGTGEISVEGPGGWNAARTDEGLLDAAVRAERSVAAAEGAKLRAIADLMLRRLGSPQVGYDEDSLRYSVQAEVGLRLRVSPSEASELTHLALYLARRLPRTFAALEDGLISLAKVKVLVEESLNLTAAQCAQLEAVMLGQAGPRTVRGFREKVRREVEKLDADAVRKRRAAAVAERCLYVKDELDGMATLCLYLPAEQARAIYDTINSRIPAHPGPGDPRRIGARRVDHAVEIFAAAFGIDLRRVADTAVPVPTAEQIARLDRGANTYVPSRAMKDAIRARDRHCRFPGCRRPAVHCDIDHTNPFNLALRTGGRTVYTKLSPFLLGVRSGHAYEAHRPRRLRPHLRPSEPGLDPQHGRAGSGRARSCRR